MIIISDKHQFDSIQRPSGQKRLFLSLTVHFPIMICFMMIVDQNDRHYSDNDQDNRDDLMSVTFC